MSAMLQSAVSAPQERRGRHDSASVELRACQECLSGCQDSLRGCQAEAARKSAAGAVAEAAFQQALATAEADFRASIQASCLCSCASPVVTSVYTPRGFIVWSRAGTSIGQLDKCAKLPARSLSMEYQKLCLLAKATESWGAGPNRSLIEDLQGPQ